MANIDQTEATALLNASLGLAAYTATATPLKLRLISQSGTQPTATANGTEITGGGYTAGGQSLAGVWGTASAGSVSNSAGAVTFANMPGSTTVSAVEIWDNSPKRKWFGSITAKTTNAGDTLTFAAGSIVVSLG